MSTVLSEAAKEIQKREAEQQKRDKINHLWNQGKTSAEILSMEFPKPVWIVPDIIPEGLTLLSGASKVGKSWLALGIASDGIDFESADNKPSHLFFFLLAPEAAAGPNIKVLAQIARLTSDPVFCKSVIHAESAQEVLSLIREAE